MVDYENVGSNGLSGCDRLSNSDYIYLFYTENAKNINLDILSAHGEAELDIRKVPAGKQSADIHLSSYLGYLIGVNRGRDCTYIIISKDKDFDKVIDFWKEAEGVQVARIQKIMELFNDNNKPPKSPLQKGRAAKKDGTIKKESATQKEVSTKKRSPVNKEISSKKVTLENQTTNGKDGVKTELNIKVQQALSQAKYSNEVINSVAKLVTSYYDEEHPEHFKSNVHNGLREKYPEEYLKIYGCLKSLLGEYSSVNTSVGSNGTESDRVVLNNRVQQILSKAKMSADVIGYVASVVVKNFGVKNSKQQIYRMIISEYGQQKGLDIYNKIKKYIP